MLRLEPDHRLNDLHLFMQQDNIVNWGGLVATASGIC